MARKRNCDCITIQPQNFPPIEVCSPEIGEIVGLLAIGYIVTRLFE